ncbi:GTPase HflX, partial [Paenibacillus sp. y28]|uniref:GTPase HflX n=1 Tax=Paenibacillus sp. y28 TaxID=3129110 RepID=UPI0030178CF2
RDRISELKAQLTEVVRHRRLHRERRKKVGAYQVALVGYTNAGKSTLLKRLTGADVLVENQLFATLDPTSRLLELPGGKEIVLTDTVGFIQNLPHDLVAAFRATLEEAAEADFILHVVDSGSSLREVHMAVVQQVLEELGAHQKESMTVYNKIDTLPVEEQLLLPAGEDALLVNAYLDDDLARLKRAIEDRLMGDIVSYRIPAEKGDIISLLYRIGDVLDQQAEDDQLEFQVRVKKQEYEQLGYKLSSYEVTTTKEEAQGRA